MERVPDAIARAMRRPKHRVAKPPNRPTCQTHHTSSRGGRQERKAKGSFVRFGVPSETKPKHEQCISCASPRYGAQNAHPDTPCPIRDGRRSCATRIWRPHPIPGTRSHARITCFKRFQTDLSYRIGDSDELAGGHPASRLGGFTSIGRPGPECATFPLRGTRSHTTPRVSGGPVSSA